MYQKLLYRALTALLCTLAVSVVHAEAPIQYTFYREWKHANKQADHPINQMTKLHKSNPKACEELRTELLREHLELPKKARLP